MPNFIHRELIKGVFILSIILTSCDCSYLNEYKIINETSGQLKVIINSSCKENDIFYIKSDSTKLICSDWTGAIGCRGPYKSYFSNQIYSVEIYLNDSTTGKKDYSNVDNWSFSEINKTGKFQLVVDSNDFIK